MQYAFKRRHGRINSYRYSRNPYFCLREPKIQEQCEDLNRKDKSNNYKQLSLEFHNINSLKLNEQKLRNLAALGKEKNLDIIGIAETNINKEESR